MAREFVARKGLIISGSTLASGSITATTYYGDGSNLTGISAGGVTINSNTDNYVLTATGTANTIQGESNLTFNGSTLSVTGAQTLSGNLTVDINTLFVDAANNRVGVGTTSPSNKLDVLGAISSSAYYGTTLGIGTTSPVRTTEIKSTGTSGTQLQISSIGSNSAGIKFVPSSGDNWELQAGTNSAFFLYNRTDNLYRWLMDGSGNFGIGTTSPSAKVHIVGTGTTTSTTALYITDSSNAFIFSVLDNGTVRAANDIIAFYSSDKNLKTNIKPLSNPIEKIKQIGGYEFDWKPESDHTGHDVGVIAQEIESILPEVVTTRTNGYKAVRYEKIVPLLIEAIKEQQKQIDELKALIK